MTHPSRPAALAAAVVALLLLAGCGAAGEPEGQTTPTPLPTAESPDPDATVAPAEGGEDEAEPMVMTCETLVPQAVVDNFASVGWSAQEEPFRVGGTEIEGGLLCTWADFESETNGELQFFGWAPIPPNQAESVQDNLLSQGWIREDGADGVFITESADTVIAPDDDGYGVTYLFGDGWVEIADTKQGLLLITSPRS